MTLHSAKLLLSGLSGDDIELSSGQTLKRFHKETDCFGDVCPVHKPSDHALRELPLVYLSGHLLRILAGVRVSERSGLQLAADSDDYIAVTIDPDDYAFLKDGEAIVRNSGICIHCRDHIQSSHRHDFSQCSCGKNYVDGGTDYLRRTMDLVDTSIVFSKPTSNL